MFSISVFHAFGSKSDFVPLNCLYSKTISLTSKLTPSIMNLENVTRKNEEKTSSFTIFGGMSVVRTEKLPVWKTCFPTSKFIFV